MNGEKNTVRFYPFNHRKQRSNKRFTKRLSSKGLFKFNEEIVIITDGSKELMKGVRESFGKYAVAQRSTWYKQENVEDYLSEIQGRYRGKLQRAYLEKPDYTKP